MAAFMAQQSLNNFYLSKYNASLSVKWVIKKDSDEGADNLDQENMNSSPAKKEESIEQNQQVN